MTTGLIILFSAVAFPFVFVLIDASTRLAVGLSADDLGPDVILVGASLCVARLFELLEALIYMPVLPTINIKLDHGVHFGFFLLWILLTFPVWLASLVLIKPLDEDTDTDGGYFSDRESPIFLSIAIGLFSAFFSVAFYVASRILL